MVVLLTRKPTAQNLNPTPFHPRTCPGGRSGNPNQDPDIKSQAGFLRGVGVGGGSRVRGLGVLGLGFGRDVGVSEN